MGRLTIAAHHLCTLHIFLAQVAVRVASNVDRHIGADPLADLCQDMVLAGAEAFHLAGTMQHHINTVDLVQVLFHRPDKAGLDVVKGVTLDDAGGSGHRVDCGDHLDARLCKNIADVHLAHTFLAKCDVIGRDLIFAGNIFFGLRDKLADQHFHLHLPHNKQ